MATYEIPKSARELGLMQGFPPAPDKRVTHANQLLAPYNRWSFQNELILNPTAPVWRGDGLAIPLERQIVDLSQVRYQNRAGTQFSLDDMVEMSYTDGMLVLHKGKLIYERYRNDFQPHSLHAWASGSKSVTGVLAAGMVSEGLIDPQAAVSHYLPELRASGFGDATLRQVMDMTSAVWFVQNDPDPISESYTYAAAMGWRVKASGPADAYEFLPTMIKIGPHGQKFTYLTPNTDVLAWVMKRVLQQNLAQIMHERLWAKLGPERDAFWIVGPGAVETAGSGLLTTLPDMARFGQMLLQKGWYNGQQIIPASVVAGLEGGGDPQAFARGPAAGPTNKGWSYRDQWWCTHNAHGAYLGLGYGGQMLYIDPLVEMVVAKFSSYPTPTAAGEEFYSMFAALPALAQALKHE